MDECKATAALKEFLNTILLKKPGGHLKFFFTSRPEVLIRREVEASYHSSHLQPLRLHDIEKDIVRADIQLYVNQELSKIPELQDEYRECWPPPEVEKIVERSDALFIVAATIVRYIGSQRGEPIARLLACGSSLAPKLCGVDQLYQKILEEAVLDLEPQEKEDLHSCLSLLVAARRPLSLADYAALIDRPVRTISAAFRSLHSVVEIPTNKEDNRSISIYHASFVDFLTGYPIASNTGNDRPQWAVNRREAHSLVLRQCLVLMNSDDRKKGLHFGISGAVTSYRNNDDQLHELKLRSDLAYACTSWGNHVLAAVPVSNSTQETITTFLKAKGLYWLEALSAERSVEYSNILWKVSKVQLPLHGVKTC